MYTQCPNCSTIFSLTDEELGAQQGLVRCGRCREVFNAPWNLVDSIPDETKKGVADSEPDRDRGADLPAPGGLSEATGSDTPRQWVVAEYDERGGRRSTDRSGDENEAITETLTLAEFATTEEVNLLGEGSGESSTRRAPILDSSDASSPGRLETELDLPGKFDEEIIIEAPTNLWSTDDDRDAIESSADTASGGADVAAGRRKPEPRLIPIARQADDVKLVEIPHPKPVQTAAWIAAALVLVVSALWQLKEYYLTDLAGIVSLRAPLEAACEVVSCTVPPRTDIRRIDLVSTSVDPHPATPGALRVSANLINRATFSQPFPPLEVTLTDKAGAVVGRRTYLPHEYRSGPPGGMSPNVLQRADLDLAQPAQTAVGYEIQLVAR